jgi:SAM-dependent methyltransferase
MGKILQYTEVEGIKCYSLEEASRYGDYPSDGFDITDKLEAESFWVSSRNRLLKKIIIKYSKDFKKPKYLEIGCGTGTFIRALAASGSMDITGSEIYLNGLFYAKSKKLPNVEFIQFDASMGVLPEKFDMVAAFDVLEHINDDVSAIFNVAQMVNDDGYFILTVPQHMFLWSNLDEIVKHKRRYSRKEMITKLKQQGFSIRYSSSFLFVLFPMMLVSRILDRSEKVDESASTAELENRVTFSKPLNWIFDNLMKIDEALIDLGISLPFGGSLLVVAQKKK